MFISNELRKTNIAEYLLYMWQVEDMLRACDCSLARVRREIVERYDCSDEQKEELSDWYGSLIRMMNAEGCRASGHLQMNESTMAELERLGTSLLDRDDRPLYRAQYYRALPYIVELRRKAKTAHAAQPPTKKEKPEEKEIETCLNALYGTMLLRLQHKEINPETQHAIDEITTLVGMLADEYNGRRKAQDE